MSGVASTKLMGSSVQGIGLVVKEDGGERGRWTGSLEMIGGNCVALSASFWPSKWPKMFPRASETDIEVFLLFRILCLFQRVIISQLTICFSLIICHFEGIKKR